MMNETRDNDTDATISTTRDAIASFDVGEKNLAYCIAYVDDGEIRTWRHVDVSGGGRRAQTIVESCDRVSDRLALENWTGVRTVLIEGQMRANVRAQRVSQHLWTWFRLSLPLATVRFVPSSWKTRAFADADARARLTSKSRKKWAVDTTTRLLTDDPTSSSSSGWRRRQLGYLRALREDGIKQDDVCDAYLQLLAYVRLSTS